MFRTLSVFSALIFTGFSLLLGAREQPVRPLHCPSVDKPVYRPGETVYFRDVMLDGLTNCPFKDGALAGISFTLKIRSPQGEEKFSRQLRVEDSTAGLAWQIPDGITGGTYTARVEDDGGEGAPAERKFEIRSYRTPRLKMRVEFSKRGFLPGEECTATLHFERTEGIVPADCGIKAVAELDGQLLFSDDSLTAVNGVATVHFTLPKEISQGDGTLAFTVADGGTVETVGRTIPLLLDSCRVNFYPEGGDLICGVKQRMYIEVLGNDGKGKAAAGMIVDENGQQVADFSTVHDGRGVVTLTPQKGQKYRLAIRNPATGTLSFRELPPSREGALISAVAPTYPGDAPVTLRVDSSPQTTQTPAFVILRKRDLELDRAEVDGARDGLITLRAQEAEGVLAATLYAKDGTPLSERLIFRHPGRKLQVSLELEKDEFSPRQQVKVRVFTRNEQGMPVQATVGLSVVDDAVLSITAPRERAPRLREMVYLENEVLELTDAADYFAPGDPAAEQKIDLLLGTQGWRRFIPLRREAVAAAYPDALRRILAPAVRPRPQPRFRLLGAIGNEIAVHEEAVPEAAPMMAMEADNAMMLKKNAGLREAVAENAEAVVLPMPPHGPQVNFKRPPQSRIWIREYAHKAAAAAENMARHDFAETLYWHAGALTDPRTGCYEFSFEMPDTVGSFAITAEAFAGNGAIGQNTRLILSRMPFYAETKLPPFLTAGDELLLPVTLVNNTDHPLERVNWVVECTGGIALKDGTNGSLPCPALSPGERRRITLPLRAAATGAATVRIRAAAGGLSDTVERSLTVLSPLFPLTFNAGGRFDSAESLRMNLEVPPGVQNGSQKTSIKIYTSPAATMTEALNALLRQPHGCFEQASSTNYPLVMAQQYFLTHSGTPREVMENSRQLLEEGYRKLTAYECSEKGYEWFGDNPGHEALTAYGLMEFADMAKIMPVDHNMVENTRRWLLSRRDGKGGFLRNQRALDSFGRAPQATTDAYILWALLESGEKAETLQCEIEQVQKSARSGNDRYLDALAANILALAGKAAEAQFFAERLVKAQTPSGEIGGVGETITCSQGESRILEGTSLAVLAWLRLPGKYTAPVESAMGNIAQRCKDGRFGSTQSTVLALKAINAYDQQFAKPLQAGNIQLMVDGQLFGSPVSFDEKTTGAITLPDCGLALTPGAHRLELRMSGGTQLSASLEAGMMTTMPGNSGSIVPAVALSRTHCSEGDSVTLFVTVTNAAPEPASMPLAVIAVPAGLEVRTAQLEEAVQSDRIAAFELKENAVVLYWRGLKAGESLTVPVSTLAVIPGKFSGAASRSYRYYTDEAVQYIPGPTVEITPLLP